ncbi:hypothetical protein GE061_016228 [Apolygus lucorum]|uniref:CCHC-type domain-containing protein n=1 Tax=Apolygus lucorum TaxID=248454 RepID=A0A8S9XFF2_APOLU|nr:hypothetical protein GE061_016228 [Apolygus lucorum]
MVATCWFLFWPPHVTENMIPLAPGMVKQTVEIIPRTTNANKSPVHHEEHSLGLESWCIQPVYCHSYQCVMNLRQNKQKSRDLNRLNTLLLGVLMINPDITSFWNMRKDLINCGKLDPCFELHFAALVLSRKPKSLDVYTHRKWVLSKILKGHNDKVELLANEMNVCEVAADRYSNNYHAWTHRLWCLNQGIAFQSNRLQFFLQELNWSQSWILRHVSDYSGFHHRQQVLSMISDSSPNNLPDNVAPLFSSTESSFKQFCASQGVTSNVEVSSILKLIISELWLNTGMINDFVAHESLWYHRRFILHMFKNHAPSCDSEANKTWAPFELSHSNGDGVPSEKTQKIEMEDVKCLTNLLAYDASFSRQYCTDKTDTMSKKYAKRHLQCLLTKSYYFSRWWQYYSREDTQTATDLADNLRVQILRIKLRGTAKTFLLDNGHLLEGEKPYQGLRRALLRWYGRDDPEKAAERLWTIQKSAGETFRQFAERVRHTATQAARADDMLMDATQKRTWIAARSVKAFLKGLPGMYAGYFVNNPPASLEEAMKKAEQLEDALEPRSSDPWNVARIQVQDKRCYRCQELGHIASGCPNIPRPPSPPPIRRKAMGMPHKPCLFCGSMTHFPASCLKNPKNYPCEFCGLYGHKDSECRVKTRQYADEPMCDYCGYYGHLEAECPQKTESYMQHEASKRPEPRKVLALTSTSHEPNPHQAVALRTEPKNVEIPSTSTPLVEEPDVCLPAVDSPFKQTMRIKVNLSGHDRVLIVDTGAQISVLTHPVPGVPIVPTRIQAWGADGQPMPFLGQQRLEVTIGPIKLTHAFRIFARDHSGLDLLGLDLLRRIPASIHLDSCEVRMIHPKTGQSIVISDVITGYLSPARPVPMPDIAQPMRPRIALVGGPHAFDSAHLLRPVNEEEPIEDDCPILDSSEEFPIEDLDDPVPDLLSVLNQQLQHLPTEDVNYVTRVPDDACVTPPVAPMADQRPEPVPCNMETDDLIPEDEDTYPVARFVEAQPTKEPEEPEPVMESPPAEVPPVETSSKTAAVAHRQLRRLPKKDYQQLHSGRPSKKPKT